MIQVICVKYHVIQKELENNNAHRGGHIIFGVHYFSVITRVNHNPESIITFTPWLPQQQQKICK